MLVRVIIFAVVIIFFGLYTFILIHDLVNNRKKIDKPKVKKNKKQDNVVNFRK